MHRPKSQYARKMDLQRGARMARLQRAEMHWSFFLEQSRFRWKPNLSFSETLVTYKAGDVQWAIAQLSMKKLVRALGVDALQIKTSSEERLQSSAQRAQAPQSACAQVIAAAWLETAATGRVRRRTKTERSLSYPNQETTLGMRRVGEPLHCSATLARLGQKHQFVHFCQQLERLQAHANLARSLEEAREMQWPSKIHQLEPSSKPPQLSPCRVFVTWRKHSTPSRGIDCGQRSQMPRS